MLPIDFWLSKCAQKNICFCTCSDFILTPYRRSCNFSTTSHTLLWSWWIATSKLYLFFITWILTHVSRKTTPKIFSHVIISKVLIFDWVVLTWIQVVLDMGQSRNWMFPLGISCRFLHCMSKELWYITSSLLSDEWRSSYSRHSSYTRKIIIVFEVILWNGFYKHKIGIAYVRTTNLSI